ncbi:FAD binding protein, partial [Aureobasidium melanogenum]
MYSRILRSFLASAYSAKTRKKALYVWPTASLGLKHYGLVTEELGRTDSVENGVDSGCIVRRTNTDGTTNFEVDVTFSGIISDIDVKVHSTLLGTLVSKLTSVEYRCRVDIVRRMGLNESRWVNVDGAVMTTGLVLRNRFQRVFGLWKFHKVAQTSVECQRVDLEVQGSESIVVGHSSQLLHSSSFVERRRDAWPLTRRESRRMSVAIVITGSVGIGLSGCDDDNEWRRGMLAMRVKVATAKINVSKVRRQGRHSTFEIRGREENKDKERERFFLLKNPLWNTMREFTSTRILGGWEEEKCFTSHPVIPALASPKRDVTKDPRLIRLTSTLLYVPCMIFIPSTRYRVIEGLYTYLSHTLLKEDVSREVYGVCPLLLRISRCGCVFAFRPVFDLGLIIDLLSIKTLPSSPNLIFCCGDRVLASRSGRTISSSLKLVRATPDHRCSDLLTELHIVIAQS